MFSGIVAEVGRVAIAARKGGTVRFTVVAPGIAPLVDAGTSVAVNGVCQTVVGTRGTEFSFDSVSETLRKTNLSSVAPGAMVNLEPALRMSDRISGHLVSGHVDGTGVVRGKRSVGRGNLDFAINLPHSLSKYVRDKGSICLDGVSLTVKALRGSMVEVTVIPFTIESTIIRNWRVGSVVNVEVDQIAKYLVPGWSK